MKDIESWGPIAVLILFALTACAGFLIGRLAAELFSGALMLVLGFYYGKKQGEAAAAAAAAKAKEQQPLG